MKKTKKQHTCDTTFCQNKAVGKKKYDNGEIYFYCKYHKPERKKPAWVEKQEKGWSGVPAY